MHVIEKQCARAHKHYIKARPARERWKISTHCSSKPHTGITHSFITSLRWWFSSCWERYGDVKDDDFNHVVKRDMNLISSATYKTTTSMKKRKSQMLRTFFLYPRSHTITSKRERSNRERSPREWREILWKLSGWLTSSGVMLGFFFSGFPFKLIMHGDAL